jgi:hypothetical protein
VELRKKELPMTEHTRRNTLTVEREGVVLFEAPDDDLPTMLLGLLCHEAAARGGTITCDAVSREKARLLVGARPAVVMARCASAEGRDILRDAGIELTLDDPTPVADQGPADPDIRAIDDTCTSADAFRDRLRMHMLSSLQKRRRLDDDWVLSTPETHLGAGGGGT